MNLASAEIKLGKTDKKGPLTLGAAGTYTTGKENGNGRFVVVGIVRWVAERIPALQRQSRPVPEHDELAVLG